MRGQGEFLTNKGILMEEGSSDLEPPVGEGDEVKSMSPSVVRLLEIAEESGLESIFQEWFKKYIGDWGMYGEYQIENLKS